MTAVGLLVRLRALVTRVSRLPRVPHPPAGRHVSLETLDALAWGELDPGESRRTLRHLRSCASCRRRLAWIRRLPSTLEAEAAGPLRRESSVVWVLDRRARGERVILPVPGRGGPGSRGRGA